MSIDYHNSKNQIANEDKKLRRMYELESQCDLQAIRWAYRYTSVINKIPLELHLSIPNLLTIIVCAASY